MLKRRMISMLLMIAMLVTYMPSMTFAADTQTGTEIEFPTVIANATSTNKAVAKIEWKKTTDATNYVVYGNLNGKKLKKLKTLDETARSFKVKKIGKKKLKKGKVYSFYVSACKNGADGELQEIAKSKICKVIVGRMMTKKNKKYSNAYEIEFKNKLVKLEKGDSGTAAGLAGISSKMYKNKKHLGNKYGAKYSYIVFNKENKIDDTVVTIDENGILNVNKNAKIGDKVTVCVQELNGIDNSFDVLVVTAEEQKTEEETPSGGGGGGSGSGTTEQEVREKVITEERTRLLEDFGVVYLKTIEAVEKSNLPGEIQKKYNFTAFKTDKVENPKATVEQILEEISAAAKKALNDADSFQALSEFSALEKTKLVSVQNLLIAVPENPSEKIINTVINTIEEIKDIEDVKETQKINKIIVDTIEEIVGEGVLCTIELSANGGTTTANNIQVNYQQDISGIKVAVPTKEGRSFSGYYTEATSGAQVVDAYGNFVKDVDGYITNNKWNRQEKTTLYAHWGEVRVKVTLDENGGETAGYAYIKYGDTRFEEHEFTAPIHEYYKLTGYYDSLSRKVANPDGTLVSESSSEYVKNGKWNTTEDVALKAGWEEITCQVTINGNGGTVDEDKNPITLNISKMPQIAFSKFPNIERTGYTFAGLYTKANGGTQIVDEKSRFIKSVDGYTNAEGRWIREQATTLYVHWKAEDKVINLDAGSGTNGSITFEYDKSSYKAFTKASKLGYVCDGYYTAYEGGEKILSADGTIVSGDGKWHFNYEKLYAHWTPMICKITLDAGGGNLGIQTLEINYGTHEMRADSEHVRPNKDGYDFKGIFTENGEMVVPNSYTVEDRQQGRFFVEECEGYVENYQWIRTQDTTLYAQWTPHTYTVELSANGGKSSGELQIEYDNNKAKNLVPVERDGFICTGYYTSPTEGDLVLTQNGTVNTETVQGWTEDGKWNSTNESAVLYPHWESGKTSVTLEANYDEGTNGSAIIGTNDTKLDIQLNANTRKGYEFLGYFDGPNDGANLIASADGSLVNVTVTGIIENGKWNYSGENISLYAHWKHKVCKITFVDPSGTNNTFTLYVNYETYKFTEQPPELSARAGYTLKGFYTASSDGDCAISVVDDKAGYFVDYCKGYIVDRHWVRTEDTILYAQWEEKLCEVTFRDNLCGNPDYKIHINYVTGKFVEEEIKLPTCDDHTLVGFETQGGQLLITIQSDGTPAYNNVDGYIVDHKWVCNHDVTLYAKWEPKSCKITLEDPSGANESREYTINYGSGMFIGNQPDIPTRIGYTFDGFYTDEEEGIKVVGVNNKQFVLNNDATTYVNDGKWIHSKDTTLYAHWIANTYTITLDKNGGDTSGQAKVDFESDHATIETPAKRANYYIDGYYTEPSAGAKVLDAQGNIVKNSLGVVEKLKWVYPNDIVLYAHWTETDYLITLVSCAEGVASGSAAVGYNSDHLNIQVGLSRTGFEVVGYETMDGKFVASADGSFGKRTVSGYIENGLWIATKGGLLRAIWKEKLCKITFRSTIGGLEDLVVYINYDTNQFKIDGDYPSVPEIPGYELVGFYTAPNEGYMVIEQTAQGPVFKDVDGYISNSKWIREKDTTLYVKWKAKEYTVTLNANSTGTDGSIKFNYDATSYNTFVPATRDGYICQGYYATSSCDGEPILDAAGKLVGTEKWNYEEITTLYAKWEANKSNVTFDANGGTGGTSSKVVSYGLDKISNLTAPTRTGYTFTGWYTSKTGGNLVVNANGTFKNNVTDYTNLFGKWTRLTDATLYAQWEANKTTITLASNSGDASSEATIAYDDTKVNDNFTKVSRTGYACEGYYTQPNGGSKVLDSEGNVCPETVSGYIQNGKWKNTSETVTLYPHWTNSAYNITISQNYEGANMVSALVKTNDTGINVKLTRKGYVLLGFFTDPATGELVASADGSFGNRTVTGYISEGKWNGANEVNKLYAHWKIAVSTITFDAKGGTPTPSAEAVEYEAQAVNVTSPTKAGYTFEGWCKDEACNIKLIKASGWFVQNDIDGYVENGKWVCEDNVTVYAKWTPTTYNVEIDTNGGTPETIQTTIKTGDTKLTIPQGTQIKRYGYILDGFYTAEIAGNKIANTEGELVAGSVANYIANGAWCGTNPNNTLYAHWTKDKCTIIFNANGGTGGSKTAIVYYDDDTLYSVDGSAGASIVNPTRTGYIFQGWYPATTYGECMISVEGTLLGNCAQIGEHTLYARWKAKLGTITLNPNGGSCTMNNVKVTGGVNSVNIKKPERDGYVFIGWFTAETGGTLVIDSSNNFATSTDYTTDGVWDYDGALTLYAHWRLDKIIRFIGDDKIDLDGTSGADKFRVIKENADGTVELMAMNGKLMHYNDTSTTTTFSDGGTYQQYKGSTLDNYLNGETGANYYASLPADVKGAIVDQDITQKAYQYDSNDPGNSTYSSQYLWGDDTRYATLKGTANDGTYSRHVYALDLDDIFEYIGGSYISSNDLNTMFFGQATAVINYCWLRPASTSDNYFAWNVYGDDGYLYHYYVDSDLNEARAAFTINLDGLSYEVVTGGTAHNVTFNPNGGSGSIFTQPLSNGSTAFDIEAPTRDGYIFTGWYTAADDSGDKVIGGNGKVVAGTVNGYVTDGKWKCANDTTLYAHWIETVSKGEIITLDGVDIDAYDTSTETVKGDGSDDQFRVIKENADGTVELMAMNGPTMHYNDTSTTTDFYDGGSNKVGTYQKYEDSTLDTYLNTTYYNALIATGKVPSDAIISQSDLKQGLYGWTSTAPSSGTEGTDYWQGKRTNTTPTTYYVTNKKATASLSSKKVYALDVQDVMDYLGTGNLTYAKLRTMFFGSETQVSRLCWLRSARTNYGNNAWFVNGNYGYLYDNGVNSDSREARAAFTIDLSKVDYKVVPQKGDIITLKGVDIVNNSTGYDPSINSGEPDGKADEFRVIKTNNDGSVELLAMNGEEMCYDNTSTKTDFYNGSSKVGTYPKYAGSTLDNYLNNTYFNKLPFGIRNKIKPQKITQKVYESIYEGESTYSQEFYDYMVYMVSEEGLQYKGTATGGEFERNVYALDIDDIFDYVGGDSITYKEMNKMFFGSELINDGGCWIRTAYSDDYMDAVFYANNLSGSLMPGQPMRPEYGGTEGNWDARPAFTIDISQVDYTVVKPDVRKGDLITLDGVDLDGVSGADEFRVIKDYGGGYVELMAMNGKNMQWNNATTTSSGWYNFDYRDVPDAYPAYPDSDIDSYLDGEYYSSLDEEVLSSMYNAQEITQYLFGYTTTKPSEGTEGKDFWSGKCSFGSPTPYYVTNEKLQHFTWNWHVYLLDVQDVMDYLGKGNLTPENINKMFFNKTTADSRKCWLRSAIKENSDNVWCIDGSTGSLSSACVTSDNIEARAAFKVNLNDVTYTKN